MDYSEKWGKDVDEAVRLALEDLNLTEDQVMVTVLEEPAKGFLGLGSKLAKVRVEKIADSEPEKNRDRKSNADKKSPGVTRDLRKKNKQGASSPDRGGSGGRDRSGGRGDGRDRSSGRGRPDGRSRSGGGRHDNDRRDGGRRDGGRRDGGRRDFDNRREREDKPAKVDYLPEIELDLSDKPQFSEKPAGLVAVVSNEASDFLKSIIGNMGIDVEVAVSENDECVYIEIDGPDAKFVIGKRGQTLDSIQYLTNLVLNKDKEDYRRVIIDVEGYRTRREKTLEQLAAKLARKTIGTGHSVRLEPMNPYERKVIHATLQKVDGITTRSEGEEPYRRVIIEKE
ncbi:MAG: protein jag [Clostridiales Family XIII bacterium]|jgi:spoIIIJ-associated protein|nr:protein jag [Clostridiales Family XIII bacterium]